MRKEPVSLKHIDELIPLGQKVEIYVPKGNFEGTYSSFLYDMDDKFLYILMPTDERGLKAVIRKNDEFYISFVDKKDRRIGFSTSLVEIVGDEDKTIYKIKKPEKEAYSIEFRENFRVDVLSNANVTLIKDSNISKGEGTIIDISASGAKLSVNVALNIAMDVGDRVFLSCKLGDTTLDNIEARVVRKAIAESEGVNHYGLRFVNLDKKLEDKLIKFCINRQFELARKMSGLE